VWNVVDKHQKKGLTSVIHGKYAHEETVATVSFCEDYICVKNYEEAQMLADYIVNGGDREAFMAHFVNAVSEGFDPDTMLKKIGLANQTTMYKKETRAIGQLLQKTMLTKFGPVDASERYLEFDTICDATQVSLIKAGCRLLPIFSLLTCISSSLQQERQDAVVELVDIAKEENLDFILVIGGWDSSNTAHLLEIPVNSGVRSFHIDRAECIAADNTITHRTVTGEIVTEKLLENLDKEIVMGVTSGASTPDKSVQDALGSIFLLKKMHTGSN
jgi:4-hydroxy-3-methylbut-2-enyl diphosphate reductase